MSGAGSIEDIILRYSGRGIDRLRSELPEEFCTEAAGTLLSLPKGTVLLTTGFYVHGHAETDGPAGTWAVGRAMSRLGYDPVIVTDQYCRGFFEAAGFRTEYFPIRGGEADVHRLFEKYQPAGLFSLERCGRGADGEFRNMRGTRISDTTAPLDLLFMSSDIPSVCVGDGGNEIGMGNLAESIRTKLGVIPSVVTGDRLVIATVSNWGGYGICAATARLLGKAFPFSYDEIRSVMELGQRLGHVDGISGTASLTEDGFPQEVTREIIEALISVV